MKIATAATAAASDLPWENPSSHRQAESNSSFSWGRHTTKDKTNGNAERSHGAPSAALLSLSLGSFAFDDAGSDAGVGVGVGVGIGSCVHFAHWATSGRFQPRLKLKLKL